MKKIAIIFSMIVTLGFISGCQSQTSSTSDKKEVITVQDAKGNVDIPDNPQRIVDLGGNSDMLSILGYKVVGTANSDAYDYTKFPSVFRKYFTKVQNLRLQYAGYDGY